MEEELPQSRLFWVLLTIFGSMFAAGPFIIFQSLPWGLFDIIVGLLGMIVLIRDRVRKTVRKVPIRTPLLMMAWAAVSIFVGHTVSQITATQEALKNYVIPRTVPEEQAAAIRKVLSAHESSVVDVVANVGDPEALEYAGQLSNAIKSGGWEAKFGPVNPWDTSPYSARFGQVFNPLWLALDRGIMIRVGYVGQRGNPDPRHPTPDELLFAAFKAANLEYGGSLTADQDKYSLIVEVGRRPTMINRSPSLFARLGRWLMDLGN